MIGVCRHKVSSSAECAVCDLERLTRTRPKTYPRPFIDPFECRKCEFVTLYQDVMIRHVRERHRRSILWGPLMVVAMIVLVVVILCLALNAVP